MDINHSLQIARAARQQEALAREIYAAMIGQRRTSLTPDEWAAVSAAAPDVSRASQGTLVLSVLLQNLPIGRTG